MSRLRSLLYVPGNRPELIAKIERFEADGYILDLEDGVPAAEKSAARDTVANLARVHIDAGRSLHLRVNAVHTEGHRQDVEMAFSVGITRLHVPKVTTADDLKSVDHHAFELATRWRTPLEAIELYPTIETSRAVLAVDAICAVSARLAGIVLGGDDLTAEWSAVRSPDGRELDYVRQRLVVAANAYGAAPIDATYPFHQDLDGCARDAERARAWGFRGKQAIHPAQCPLFNRAFTPTSAELTRARSIIAAAETARDLGRGTSSFGGTQIDAAVEKSARRVLEMDAG